MNEHLGEICRYWGRWHPHRSAIRFDGADTSWGELDDLSERVAGGLARHGVRHGDSVAILMKNRPEYIVAILGALKAGAVVTPLNDRWTSHELVHPITDAGARVVITEASLAGGLNRAENALSITAFSVDPSDGCRDFADLTGADRMAEPVAVASEDAAFMCYTSGTTGFPKGALLSHGAIRAGAYGRILAEGITYRDRVLLPVPLAFTGGSVSMYTQLVLVPGGTCVLEREYDPARCLGLIEAERLSVVIGVPVVLQIMADLPQFDSTDLSTVTSLSSGGAPVPVSLIERYQARGVAMTQAYGLTEACGAVTLLSREDAVHKLGSAGRPILHTEVRIGDDSDNEVAAGEVGQILVRGPSVMSGYKNLPEETAAALAGGWLHTGDVGTVDVDGYLRVVDRKKEMLISGGINVYPAEIERVLSGAITGQEFAVVGVPDERWGEVPVIVVNDLSKVDTAALAARCAEQLAGFKRPKAIVGTGAPFPRSLSGKVLKGDLAALYPALEPTAVPLR